MTKPISLDDLKFLAGSATMKKEQFEESARRWMDNVEPMGASDFNIFLDAYRKNVIHALFHRERFDPVDHAADETMRAAVTGENKLDFSKFPSFIRAYRQTKSMLYKALDDCDLGRGDDSYGDLMDSLPLLGVDAIKHIIGGKITSNKTLTIFVNKTCLEYVQKWVGIPWNDGGGDHVKGQNVEQIAEKWALFILNGENYNEMKLGEQWQERFCLESRQDVPEDDGHIGDDAGFDAFLKDATAILGKMWKSRGGILKPDEQLPLTTAVMAFFAGKRASRR